MDVTSYFEFLPSLPHKDGLSGTVSHINHFSTKLRLVSVFYHNSNETGTETFLFSLQGTVTTGVSTTPIEVGFWFSLHPSSMKFASKIIHRMEASDSGALFYLQNQTIPRF